MRLFFHSFNRALTSQQITKQPFMSNTMVALYLVVLQKYRFLFGGETFFSALWYGYNLSMNLELLTNFGEISEGRRRELRLFSFLSFTS